MTTEPAVAAKRRLLTSAEGTSSEAFGAAEWTMLFWTAAIWGSSFLLIAIGLDAFAPGVVATARVALGAGTLALVPKARRGVIEREDRATLALLGAIWIGVPMLLFPIAEQWISSSLAGMVNGGVPLTSALFATLFLRRLPGRRQLLGLVIGFVGLFLVTAPALAGADATALGAGLLLIAVLLYGISLNLAVPLQQKYGSLPVLLRAQLAGLVVVTPVGLWQLPESHWAWPSALAMIPLGVLSTALAFVLMTTLAGRVGAARAGVTIYFTPIFAILLGVAFRSETIAPLSLIGMGVTLVGAWLTTRKDDRATPKPPVTIAADPALAAPS